MASSENQQQNPDPAPPSHSAGDLEMRDYYATQAVPRPPSQQESYLTPYLGLRARLSQTWINRWTILLLLVLIRTLFAIASLDDNLGTARKQALSACTSVENVGSAMASMPYYMSQGVNELSAQGIERAINGLVQMLILSITGVEEIVVFIINLLTSTYVCLITLAVSGSLHVAVSVAEDVGNLLNSTIKDVGKDLGSAADGFESAMNGFLADIDKLGSFLTGKTLKPPTIDLTSEITTLSTIDLPPGYDQGLEKLNASIPNFAQVNNFTNWAIKLPFEEVKKLMNESMPKYTMNRSLFPVPQKEALTFCSDTKGVDDFFDDLVAVERLAKKIFLCVIVVLAILAMMPMAYWEIRRWRFMKDRAQIIKNGALDSMDSVYIVSRPYTADAGLKIANHFSSTRRKALVRWGVAYATTVPALFVLSLAIAGLLACLCQYILLKAIVKEVPVLENQVIGFADKVVNQLNNASQQWAIGTNSIINDTNFKINEDVFGWVNTTTHAVNTTLNLFVDGMVDALNVTFGGTILYEPILEVLNCLVILKIQGIEKGLTWVSDNAHIDFPYLPNDTFSLGTVQKVSGSEADILATGANGGAADAITDAVFHVTNLIAKATRQEAIISTCLLLIWVFIALIGISRACFLMIKGGDSGVYAGRAPTDRSPPPEDKHELDQFFRPGGLPRVPTYEQATGVGDSGDHAGNKYNGQTYTLTPNPLPRFEVNTTTSPIFHTGFNPPNEKLGSVNGQYVDSAIRRPTHIRASSHGDYAVTSPYSPPQLTPSLSANHAQSIDPKSNPFADPTR